MSARKVNINKVFYYVLIQHQYIIINPLLMTNNSIIITYQDEYHRKVTNFLSNNNFAIVKKDVTEKFQKDLRNNINECQ